MTTELKADTSSLSFAIYSYVPVSNAVTRYFLHILQKTTNTLHAQVKSTWTATRRASLTGRHIRVTSVYTLTMPGALKERHQNVIFLFNGTSTPSYRSSPSIWKYMRLLRSCNQSDQATAWLIYKCKLCHNLFEGTIVLRIIAYMSIYRELNPRTVVSVLLSWFDDIWILLGKQNQHYC